MLKTFPQNCKLQTEGCTGVRRRTAVDLIISAGHKCSFHGTWSKTRTRRRLPAAESIWLQINIIVVLVARTRQGTPTSVSRAVTTHPDRTTQTGPDACHSHVERREVRVADGLRVRWALRGRWRRGTGDGEYRPDGSSIGFIRTGSRVATHHRDRHGSKLASGTPVRWHNSRCPRQAASFNLFACETRETSSVTRSSDFVDMRARQHAF